MEQVSLLGVAALTAGVYLNTSSSTSKQGEGEGEGGDTLWGFLNGMNTFPMGMN